MASQAAHMHQSGIVFRYHYTFYRHACYILEEDEIAVLHSLHVKIEDKGLWNSTETYMSHFNSLIRQIWLNKEISNDDYESYREHGLLYFLNRYYVDEAMLEYARMKDSKRTRAISRKS